MQEKVKYISSDKNKIIEFRSGILAWIDEDTNLMWEVKHEGNFQEKFTYDSAFEYVDEINQMKYAGFSDWRLPNLCEVLSLIHLYDECHKNEMLESDEQQELIEKIRKTTPMPKTNEHGYLKLPLTKFITDNGYWTTTIYGRNWYIDFKNDFCWCDKEYMQNNIICVRGEKKDCYFDNQII